VRLPRPKQIVVASSFFTLTQIIIIRIMSVIVITRLIIVRRVIILSPTGIVPVPVLAIPTSRRSMRMSTSAGSLPVSIVFSFRIRCALLQETQINNRRL